MFVHSNYLLIAVNESQLMVPVATNRKRFRPTPQELEVLKAHHQGNYRESVAARALQFRVTEKQIMDWHKRFKPD